MHIFHGGESLFEFFWNFIVQKKGKDCEIWCPRIPVYKGWDDSYDNLSEEFLDQYGVPKNL